MPEHFRSFSINRNLDANVGIALRRSHRHNDDSRDTSSTANDSLLEWIRDSKHFRNMQSELQ